MIIAFGSLIWYTVLDLIGILVAIILLFIIGDAIYIIYKQYKKHQKRLGRISDWEKIRALDNICAEYQHMDKIIEKLCPKWHKETGSNRWKCYANWLNSKDGDDNGTKENR